MTLDMRPMNNEIVTKFRETGGIGSVGPLDFERCVLITTTGRSSGVPHTVPLGAVRDDGDNLLLFASNMAAPKHPDWYCNIEADPRVKVEITGVAYEAKAEILTGEERDTAYRRWIEAVPHVADHQEKAGRTIPMVRVPPG